MLKKVKRFWKKNSLGQNMTEYVLVFAGVAVALVIALGPSGFVTTKIDETVNLAVRGTKCIALQTCFDPAGCPTVCGNGCCEAGETVSTCAADCSLCMSDADCDDGVACNGAETCNPATGCQPGGAVCGNCTGPDATVIPHGGSKVYYQNATEPFGGSCTAETRVCNDGSLSGSFAAPSCSVSGPAACGAIPHGGSQRFYQSATVPCGDPCIWEMRTCTDGVLSGSYPATTCAEVCTGCVGPDAVNIPNGGSRIYYQAAQEECWTVCNQETRHCVDGVLSGSYTAPACFITVCNDGIACTDDTCENNVMFNWGCLYTPNDALCDDGVTCTGTDNPGALPGPRNNWAAMGDDWCSAATGCVFQPHDSWCDDSVACTVDSCNVVTDCQNPPNHAFCNDGVTCTDDWCDVLADCQNNPNDAHCTATGMCADGVCDQLLDCQYTPNDGNCDDSVGCTDDWCDGTFNCHYDPNDANCPDDGVSCTTHHCNAVTDCQITADDSLCPPDEICADHFCHMTLDCQTNFFTVQCRASAGVCDPAEVCDGANGTCPADAKSTAVCRPSAGMCDLPESCDGVNDGCPADAKMGTIACRPSVGPCDMVDSCDGFSNDCVDVKRPNTYVCRASAGVCDLADTCDGVGDACPADVKSTAVCRPSAGACDIADVCDGANDVCPVDAKSTAVCRPSAGGCDTAETCDGASDACPADVGFCADVKMYCNGTVCECIIPGPYATCL